MGAGVELRWEEAVKEHPILFSAPMVLAILGGTKTQTRRVVKPQPIPRDDGGYEWPCHRARTMVDVRDMRALGPYGSKRDRLWVRETWAKRDDCEDGSDKAKHYLCYRADRAPEAGELSNEWHQYGKWRPSIHMPRWASRLMLEVTQIRVERLQDITESDAKAEGVTPLSSLGADQPLAGESLGRTHGTHPHVLAFAVLWDTINGDRPGCAWRENPWIWVVGFQRVLP